MVPFETDNTENDVEDVESSASTDVSEADLVEQMTPAGADDERDDSTPESTPLEVNPADAAEQRRSVPADEDYPHG
ncbi:hypothetical protein [Prescottella agglutinans]|uniref:Uncharacterized protein n=1 Tax=Prescottella agglutinans TaxID=1644129 RepID=A0ABT6MI72_9NOCA|nr:hypothetical protein [Prescottella agglutinans]MDH6283014.1 hypothetical protein [Prescottella agglutinans]